MIRRLYLLRSVRLLSWGFKGIASAEGTADERACCFLPASIACPVALFSLVAISLPAFLSEASDLLYASFALQSSVKNMSFLSSDLIALFSISSYCHWS